MSALPPVGPAAIPADVRAEGAQAVGRYETALNFEQLLLSNLLTEALPEEGGEGEETEPKAVGMPEALADAIGSAGGTGLAADLYRSLGGPAQATTAAPATAAGGLGA